MKRACERFDPDLLMLVHRDLDRPQALRLRAHLLTCTHCRARLRKLESLTGSLATAFANPSLGARTFRPVPRTAWTSVGLVLVIFSAIGWLVSTNLAMATPSAPSIAPTTNQSCHSCHAEMAAAPPPKLCKSKAQAKPNLSTRRPD